MAYQPPLPWRDPNEPDPMTIHDNYTQFKKLLEPHVPKEFLEWLDTTDCETAPAAATHHSAYKGGLVEHSLGVYKYLRKLVSLAPLYTEKQVTRTALLHDLCKVGIYHPALKRKQIDGKWVEYDGYETKDPYPCGHGSKSVAVALQHGVDLDETEVLAITHHMGAYQLAGMDLTAYGEATKMCPLVLMTGWADLAEAQIDPVLRERRTT